MLSQSALAWRLLLIMFWFIIREWDYMDSHPNFGYRLFNDMNEAKEWEKQMNENYSGGETTVLRHATKAEILKYIEGLELDEITMRNINNDDYYLENINKSHKYDNVNIEIVHIGQYHPYGDTHRVFKISSNDNLTEQDILDIMKDKYQYDVPTKANFNCGNPMDYFTGYCEITKDKSGIYTYDKVEPYDD